MKLNIKKNSSKNEFLENYRELLYIIISAKSNISSFLNDLTKIERSISTSVLLKVKRNASSLLREYENLEKEICLFIENFEYEKYTKNSRLQYRDFFERLRILQGQTGFTLISLDWQSPSFYSSIYPEAGKQIGKIIPHVLDYKRDIHLDEIIYEKLFKQEYITKNKNDKTAVYMTNSGMAALTTILNFIIFEDRVLESIIIGSSTYFESKQLINGLLKKNIIEIEEGNDKLIYEKIKKENPSILFFDSLCNSPCIPVPNLEKIVGQVVLSAKKDLYIVIDNTSLAIDFHSLQTIIKKNPFVRLIFFESLNKYHQFGLDRVTGGIILAYGNGVEKLSSYREHLGTNILDSSVYCLPRPNKKILQKRLKRFERNAEYLATELKNYISQKVQTSFADVIYPKTITWLRFHGSYLNLILKIQYKDPHLYETFVKICIKKAIEFDVQLISGTSFGFNTTRIYLTASRSDFVEPFIRISLGTETLDELFELKKVFISAIDYFDSLVVKEK